MSALGKVGGTRHLAVAVDELSEEKAQSRPLLPLGREHKGQFGPLFGGSPIELGLGNSPWSLARANKEVHMQVFSDENLSLGLEGIRKKFLSLQTVEERLEGLGPEEVLARYSPEEMLRGLSWEQRKRLRQLLEEEDDKDGDE